MSDPMQDKDLTPARLQAIQARINPGRFLQRFSTLLERDGDALLETLFAIAKGTWDTDPATNQRRLLSDPKDVMTALRLIKDMGAFDEVVKYLLQVSRKGRPKAEGQTEVPSWAADYADAEVKPVEPAVPMAPPPPKKAKAAKVD